jgi:site-specific DNA-methyltransferase (adenine-specific)
MRPYYSGSDIKIFNGDCIDVLRGMDAENIDMCITSPPYWGLRDYGEDGQLGLEPTYQEYIDKLIAIFDEVKRVLKDTGTCWVNIADSYGGCQGRGDGKGNEYSQKVTQSMNIMAKSLIGIPERFAIAMTDAGWIRRNTIIWHKPNCMPSSADDRFTVDFEYLYFFTKKTKYWFEQQFEPHLTPVGPLRDKNKELSNEGYPDGDRFSAGLRTGYGENGRNKRCVWKIPTQSYSDAHFATYPEELVATPIKAGCPKYICKECGKARDKIMERDNAVPVRDKSKVRHTPAGTHKAIGQKHNEWLSKNPLKDKGYTDCGCNAGFKGGTVLDPFMGSGTTLKVARELGRKGIGIELNPEYIEMALKRINVSQELLKI